MAYGISDEAYEKHGGEDSGRDSLNFTEEKHTVAAVDTPSGHDPQGAQAAARETEETDSHESRMARHGASISVQGGSLRGDSLPFNPSSGCFTSGPDVSSGFERAIRDSGGVRQGGSWTSDAAPGVHRCTVEHTITLDSLAKPEEHGTDIHAGSGNTFEAQRHSNWSHDKWGG